MDIHKPKPWHGLREFLKEYLIIVVGVLTALSAEAGVEWLHWRHVTEEAREELAADQRRAVRWIGLTDASSACVLARLNELSAILDRAEHDGRLPPLGAIEPPPAPVWGMKSWDTVVSSQVLTHLRRGEASLYAVEAMTNEALRSQRDAARLEWGVLGAMSGPGRPLNAAEAANLRAALGRAKSLAVAQRRSADALGQQMFDTHLLTKAEVEAWWRKGAALPSRTDGVCAPLSTTATSTGSDRFLQETPAPPSRSWNQMSAYERLPQ